MTGISKDPKRALGVRTHSGWAAYVVLEGSAKAPDIAARGRMLLCDWHKQPFHEAETMPFARAETVNALAALIDALGGTPRGRAA